MEKFYEEQYKYKIKEGCPKIAPNFVNLLIKDVKKWNLCHNL